MSINKQKIHCRVCGNISQIYDENIEFMGSVRSTSKPFKLDKYPSNLYRCSSCQHMQIPSLLPKDYYDNNYALDNSHLDKLMPSKRKKIEKLAHMSKSRKKCLEIGCGEGITLSLTAEFYSSIVGIEPALNFYNKAKEKSQKINDLSQCSVTILNKYFNAKTLKEKEFESNFSAFYSIMVFEHLENPKLILTDLYNVLEEGGVGLINVPNGQAIYHQSLSTLFPAEHINYFTPLSLITLATSCGFEVLELSTNEYESENLFDMDIYIRRPNNSALKPSLSKLRMVENINVELSKFNYITIWGAGNNSHFHADALSENIKIKHIIDASSNRQGKYINNLDLQIQTVNPEIIKASDAILIFASSFNSEIIESLRVNYKFKGKIVYFHDGNVCSSIF